MTMPVTPCGNNDGFGGGWGEGGWFWIILIVLLFGGWGYGGYGGFGGARATESTSVYEGYVLNNDMSILNRAIADQTLLVDRKFEGVTNGLCDGFYTTAQQINGVTQSIADSNYAIQNAITQTQINAMQNQNALQTQIAGCCCDNKALLADVQYNMATQNCATNNAINTNFGNLRYEMAAQDCQIRQTVNDVGRNLVDVQNGNTQAILAAIQSIKDDAKDEKIATLTAKLSDARLIANNNAQTAVFTTAINDAVERLTPKPPVAAFQVPAPWQYSGCNCGYNNGCGC